MHGGSIYIAQASSAVLHPAIPFNMRLERSGVYVETAQSSILYCAAATAARTHSNEHRQIHTLTYELESSNCTLSSLVLSSVDVHFIAR